MERSGKRNVNFLSVLYRRGEGPTRDELEKAKDAIQFLSSISVGETGEKTARNTTSDAGCSSNGELITRASNIGILKHHFTDAFSPKIWLGRAGGHLLWY